MYIISSPLRVPVSKKKKWSLNLNLYRNAHYMTLNNAKRAYKEILTDRLAQKLHKGSLKRIQVTYRLYPATKRKMDLGNVLSVHQKFFEDSLVELGYIEDDNYEYILKSIQEFGAIDKENPRVDIIIQEIT